MSSLFEKLFHAIESNLAIDLTTLDNLPNLDFQTKDGTLLIEACYQGNEIVANKLIEKGANVNLLNDNGDSALTWAVYNGMKNTITKLIAANADVNILDNDGDTPLLLACVYYGNSYSKEISEESAIELLEAGADFNFFTSNGRSVIASIRKNNKNNVLNHIKFMHLREFVESVNSQSNIIGKCFNSTSGDLNVLDIITSFIL